MLIFKQPSISLQSLRPQLVIGILVIKDIFDYLGQNVIITSCNDGTHRRNSLHYSGQAVDIRSKNLTLVQKDIVRDKGNQHLTNEFDFILEDLGMDNEHFHLEWQPKKR